MIYQHIVNDFNDFEENINDGGVLNNAFLKHYKYPPEIINLIKEDYKTVFKIIQFYYKDFSIKLNSMNLSQALLQIDFIKNAINDKKTKFIRFNNIILPWLKTDNFFINIYEELEINDNVIRDTDIITFKELNQTDYSKIDNFELRVNQKEAIDRLYNNGLETGIHCHATGCGKTIIILKYCDYFVKQKIKGNIILFTERVNILADLFGFQPVKGIYDVSMVDENNKKEWKRLNIIDLNKFEVINRVTQSGLDWDETMMTVTKKPKILVINRAYLTRPSMYKKLTKNHLGMVLHDECHSSTSKLCYDFLKYCSDEDIPIVGFSATPLRAGKTKVNNKMESNLSRLLNIYGKEGNLNILTNYNMIYAISNKLILPPKFYWYQFELENEDKKELEKNPNNKMQCKELSNQDFGLVSKMINDILPLLANKKIIAWCGTISFAEEWKKMFEDEKNKGKKSNIMGLFPFIKSFDFYIDHSLNSVDYTKFRDSDGNAILFCANKHREGSDIKKLDCCIFLDKVINRTSIPFIQSIGRVLRIDPKCPEKQCGIVIDGFAKNNNNYEKEMVDKIIGYYLALNNMSSITEDETKYESYIKLLNIVNFDKENKLIKININNQNITIDCNKLEWNKIIEKFEPILQEKIKLSTDDNFKHKSKILKEVFGFNKKTNFVKEYNKISQEDKIKYNLPDINSDDYSNLLNNKSWFEFLEIDHNYYSLEELINKIKQINITINKQNWKEIYKIDNKIPKYPEYCYQNFTYRIFNKIKSNYDSI